MGTVAFFERTFLCANKFIRKTLVTYGEYKNIKRKKKLIDSVTLTKEQEKEIREYFKEFYGKSISTKWHRLYQSYLGTYRHNYFPEILYTSKLEPLTNPYRTAELFGDKNLLDSFFGDIEGVHIPHTYVSCVNGVIRCDNTILNLDAAAKKITNIGNCVIKKTVETSSGRDVMLCNIVDGYDTKTKLPISEILRSFGSNYVVQEKIEQSDVLKQFNASSLNTFRVITYILDDEIKVCPISFRMGRGNADRDNIHYGGIVVGVNQSGELKEYAFSEYGEKLSKHPDSQVEFSKAVIPQVPKIIETAKILHQHMPYLGILSWDLSLDSNNVPVLIEMNSIGQSVWFCQMINGEPLFGEDTPKMLAKIRK